MVILNMDEKFPRQLTFSYFFPVTYMKYEFERKIVMIFFCLGNSWVTGHVLIVFPGGKISLKLKQVTYYFT